ncbi:FecR family protein [Sulfitobacter sp. D35]|uniref:FecR family protein n=1 Tax=Sulfitobacter sp. D35 TaxID=3083252 RepID=UPI00296EB390|nr:FecR family protein [Sulfitobacter sp. D35]MDW4499892.1 FecR family protein [Sulfitobacter sp. D35]
MIPIRFVAAALASALIASPVLAQVPAGCAVTAATDPDRSVLTCEGGLVVEIEAATQLGLVAADPRRLSLEDGAILVQSQPGSGPRQVRTPHAIAAVRGTVFAVDVADEATSVFVVEGAVSVQQTRAGGDDVLLEQGEGVDVTPGEALEVKTWGAARVAALLARFGR